MKAVQGQKKNQKIGKAGVAVAVALIFTSTFSGDIQTFIQGGLAESSVELKTPAPAQVIAPAAPVVPQLASQSASTVAQAAPVEVSAETDTAVSISEAPSSISPPKASVAAASIIPKPASVVREKAAPKVAPKPREAAPVTDLKASPPQIVYQADLPPVPTFAPPQIAPEKPLKFSAPAKAVREMPRTELKPEMKAEQVQTMPPTQTTAAPAGVYSLNTAPTQSAESVVLATPVTEKPAAKPMPTVKTQAGDKAVLSMPDGTTRVVTLGESVPGYGVVNKLTKNEVIFGANK